MDVSPAAIARRLIAQGTRLDELTDELARLGDAAAEAKKNAKVAYARAYLACEGEPVETRKQRATLAAADAEFEQTSAEYRVTACKEAIRAVHAHIDTARTLASNVRAEISLAGSGATT